MQLDRGALYRTPALVAAVLNAAFGFCLGCEGYSLIARVRSTGRVA